MILSAESVQYQVIKFFGKHFLRHAYEKHLAIEVLRKYDVKKPKPEQVIPCDLEIIKNEVIDIVKLTPPFLKPNKLILFVHGGGYVSGPTILHWKMLTALAEATGYSAFVPLYRLAPEHNFYSGSADILSSYHFIKTQHPNTEVILMGDSSGGALALSIAMQLRDKQLALPKKIVLFSPWLDASFSDPCIAAISSNDAFLALKGVKQASLLWTPKNISILAPYISPIFGNLEGLPPCMLQVGTHDITYVDAKKFYHKAKEAGIALEYIEAPDMCHAWTLLVPFVPEANQSLENVITFIK